MEAPSPTGIGVSVSTLAATPLFSRAPADVLRTLAARGQLCRVRAGEWVFREGDEAGELFVVLRGRVGVVGGSGEERRTSRVLASGATIGELALLTGAPRSASVWALRDTTLLRLDRPLFLELIDREAGFAAAVARELAKQLRASGEVEPLRSPPALIALTALSPQIPLRAVASSLAGALGWYGSVATLDATAMGSGAIEQAEDEHDHVLLVDERGAGVWSDLCARQADRRMLVATADTVPPGGPSPDCDLVIVGPVSGPAVRTLVDRVRPRSIHRLASTDPGDPDAGRWARRTVGRSLGLVLSGGGARGFAHIGVLAALEEDRIEVDRYGGCSMGALIAAMAASGRRAVEIRDLCHEELVRRSVFNDYTFPRVALIRSRKAERMLRRLFADLTIEELTTSLFTVSADLVSSRLVVHRRGGIADAVGASMSVPGLMPPVPQAGHLLVDGGVLDNLPVDVMAVSAEGPIVAVDVARRLEPGDADAQRPLPSIFETLSRATLLGSVERAERNRELAALVVSPDVQDVPLRDFDSLDRAVEAGHAAARAALDEGGREAILAAVGTSAASG